MSKSLSGLTVVNTRPAHQAQPLSESITAAGGTVIDFPVLEIVSPLHPESIPNQLSRLSEANIAVFISANAVDAGIDLIGGCQNWPESVAIAAVGRATAAKLSSRGLQPKLVAPEPFNSEALLTLPELQYLSGKAITIFRGEGGREYLAQSLRERGAEVEYLECYRRVKPKSDAAKLYQCWDEKRVLLIVVTSNEGLQNLVDMVDADHRTDLLSSTLVVVSQRAIGKARELGFQNVPELSANASNDAILETIYHWYETQQA